MLILTTAKLQQKPKIDYTDKPQALEVESPSDFEENTRSMFHIYVISASLLLSPSGIKIMGFFCGQFAGSCPFCLE